MAPAHPPKRRRRPASAEKDRRAPLRSVPTATSGVRIRPRITLSAGFAIGPGKIDLLQAIDERRSISAAGRAMGMSYKRAWDLIDEMNRGLVGPVVATATGGSGGGGAVLTELGRAVVRCYGELERRLDAAVADDVAALRALVRQANARSR